MKTIKLLILLIILGLAGLLIYQNIDYFTSKEVLTLNLKFIGWTAPELPNWAFWGICLGLGLLITGLKGLGTAFGLGREIKKKNRQISELTAQNTDLQARLDVFLHDPYIKKGLSDTPASESDIPALQEQTESDMPAASAQTESAPAPPEQTESDRPDPDKPTPRE
jgi:hypothetical protein